MAKSGSPPGLDVDEVEDAEEAWNSPSDLAGQTLFFIEHNDFVDTASDAASVEDSALPTETAVIDEPDPELTQSSISSLMLAVSDVFALPSGSEPADPAVLEVPGAAAYLDEAWLGGTWDIGLQDAESNALMGVNAFRADSRFAGIDGSGYSIVVIDTGINYSHPYFSGHIAYSYDFSGSNDSNATDYNGHGSNVGSIAMGSIGVANGANIIALKVFPDSSGSASYFDVEEALQWVINNGAAYNVVSVNLSLGAGVNYSVASTHFYLGNEFATLASQGVIVAGAAGNSYYSYQTQGASDIAADPNVIGVGAVYDGNSGGWSYGSGARAYSSGADQLTPFTQRSTTLTDIFAPGAPITGAGASGSNNVTMHGTSQATPQIAGIAALAQELAVQTIGRKLTVAEFTSLLTSTAISIYDGDDENDNVTNTGQYYKRVDVVALGSAILAMDAPSTLTGTGGDDTLTATRKSVVYGLDGNDTLTGSSGIDTLDGGNGDDLLYGAGGIDTLIGGTGNDTFIVDGSSITIVENSGGGTDLIQASVSASIQGNIEILTLTGSNNLTATGNSGNDTLLGNSGNNVLNGGSGTDYLAGGAGNDTYHVDNAGDAVVEQSGQGSADRMISTLSSTTIAANVEVLELGGTGNFTAFGSTGNDTLIGNAGANLLDGGAGADRLAGGDGNDVYVLDNAGDVIVEGSAMAFATPAAWTIKGTADLNGDGQLDALAEHSSTTMVQLWLLVDGAITAMYDLPAPGGWRVQGFADLDGDGDKDVFYTNASTTLQYVYYLSGTTRQAESYVTGQTADAVQSLSAVTGGTDLVQASVSYALGSGAENLTLASGAGAINGTGNGLSNIIAGNESANRLTGMGGVDTLTGNGGADVFAFDDGDTGAALGMRDLVTDFVSGTDQLDLAAIDADGTVAGDNALRFLGTAAFDGQAGALRYSYDAGRNVTVLSGDTNGDGSADFAIELAGNVTLAVSDFASGSLLAPIVASGDGGMNTLVGDAGADTLSGQGGNDTLRGLGGNDTLDGGSGMDRLIGGGGNDVYVVDDAGDVVVEASGLPIAVPGGWVIKGTADLNGDGQLDALVENTAGTQVQLWTLSGGTIAGPYALPAPAGWRVAGFSDLDGDGDKDVFYTNPSTTLQYGFLLNGTAKQGEVYVSGRVADAVQNLPGVWVTKGTADLNGDGQLDMLVESTDGTQVQLWTVQDGVVTSTTALPAPAGWRVQGFADLDGDGDKDVFYTNPSTTLQYGFLLNGTAKQGEVFVSGRMADAVQSLPTVSGGTDLVQASVSYTLAANVENLTLASGAGAINGTGNGLSNIIAGNESANTITGLAGADTLTGGAGADVFVFASQPGNDVVTDFLATTDMLQFDGALFASAADVIAGAADDGSGNTRIIASAGNVITLLQLGLADLQLHIDHISIV